MEKLDPYRLSSLLKNTIEASPQVWEVMRQETDTTDKLDVDSHLLIAIAAVLRERGWDVRVNYYDADLVVRSAGENLGRYAEIYTISVDGVEMGLRGGVNKNALDSIVSTHYPGFVISPESLKVEMEDREIALDAATSRKAIVKNLVEGILAELECELLDESTQSASLATARPRM